MPATKNKSAPAKVDTHWFRDRLRDASLSQRQLAFRLGLDPAAVSLMLRGMRGMTAAEASGIAKLLSVSAEEVLQRAGVLHHAPADTGLSEAPPRAWGGLEVPVPLSDGATLMLKLPRKLSKADAEKISAVVKAFAETE